MKLLMKKMNRWKLVALVAFMPLGVQAQEAEARLLTLDSCRAMALRNNKQMQVAAVKQEVAANIRRSARTKYLPHVSGIGSYTFNSREVSLLNDTQKSNLSNLGTNFGGAVQQGVSNLMAQMPVDRLAAVLGGLGLSAEALQQIVGQSTGKASALLNQFGQDIVDAFRSDTRNIWTGSILLTQPLFMGGAITAANRMADIQEEMAATSADARRQATLYNIDRAYWQVVSLNHKKLLAESYRDVVKKLDGDVSKMIAEGVAKKSDGLSVSVKLNEAEMTVTKVNDGLVLSKMLLCQLCGLPINERITLADENSEDLSGISGLSGNSGDAGISSETAFANRPELKLLQSSVDLAKESTHLLKAGNLPQVLLTGGYSVSNPNLLNGFEKKFGGFWHVGVLVRVPIWNWGDVKYKVRASKGAATIASLELDEARELIELQVNQNAFRVEEAQKTLKAAQKNIERAEENLRTANLGFQEGVITPTTVMEAQTAWLQAQSQKIDAEIDVRLSEVELQKTLGVLE